MLLKGMSYNAGRISNFFKFKDRPSKGLRSNVVYKFLCGNCNVTYYGKTIRHLKVRASEHMCVSALTGKVSNSKQSTAVRDHLPFCSHQVSIHDFSARNNFELELKESLLIHKDNPSLNKTPPLHLCTYLISFNYLGRS